MLPRSSRSLKDIMLRSAGQPNENLCALSSAPRETSNVLTIRYQRNVGSTPVYGVKIVTNRKRTMNGHKAFALTSLFILVCTPPYLLADNHGSGGVSTGLNQMGAGEKVMKPPLDQEGNRELNCQRTPPAETEKLNSTKQQEHDKESEILEKLLKESSQPTADLPPPYQGGTLKALP